MTGFNPGPNFESEDQDTESYLEELRRQQQSTSSLLDEAKRIYGPNRRSIPNDVNPEELADYTDGIKTDKQRVLKLLEEARKMPNDEQGTDEA